MLFEKIRESETVELKRSTSELKEAIISMVAMLNRGQSGTVYFGIRSDGTAEGQDVTEKTIREISKAISDQIEPKIHPKIFEELIDEKHCLRVEVIGNDAPTLPEGGHTYASVTKTGRFLPKNLKA